MDRDRDRDEETTDEVVEVWACGDPPADGGRFRASLRFILCTIFATNKTFLVSWSTMLAAEVVCPVENAWLPEFAVFAMLQVNEIATTSL